MPLPDRAHGPARAAGEVPGSPLVLVVAVAVMSRTLLRYFDLCFAGSSLNEVPSMRVPTLLLLGLLLPGCGSIGLTFTAADTGGLPPEWDTDADADADADGDADGDADSDADADVESAPELQSFDMAERSSSSEVEVSFQATDVDNDLSGGKCSFTMGSRHYDIEIPDELDAFNPSGTSRFTVDASHLGAGETVQGSLFVKDAGNHSSNTLTDSLTLAGSSYTTTEVGDTSSDTDNIGVISLPATITGNIYRASNDGYAYTGDLDWIDFRVSSDATATFTLTWDATGSDYDLHLLRDGSTEAQSIQDGGTQPETFTRPLYAGTNYTLIVGGWNGSGGGYTVVID
jgi:hypothetical protein